MKILSYTQLATSAISALIERAARINTLNNSKLFRRREIDADEAVNAALESLRENPRRVLDWLSEDEIALFIAMEEL